MKPAIFIAILLTVTISIISVVSKKTAHSLKDRVDKLSQKTHKAQTEAENPGTHSQQLSGSEGLYNVRVPPDPDQLKKIIPSYESLFGQIQQEVAARKFQVGEKDLELQIAFKWNALQGIGGTPITRLKWEMSRFVLAGMKGVPMNYKDPDERNYDFRCGISGSWKYYWRMLDLEKSGEKANCWKKLVQEQGKKRNIAGEFEILTWGGKASNWFPMEFDGVQKKWHWRSENRRDDFYRDYRQKIIGEISSEKERSVEIKGEANIDSIIGSFEPQFKIRLLTLIEKDLEKIPWPDIE